MDAPAFVVGLTGGIGSGKTTVSDLFSTYGATVIDADAISRVLTARDGAAIPTISQQFGARFVTPNGALDRAAMRSHVFENPSERLRLEAILHPMIRSHMFALLAAATHAPYVLWVVPLLAEQMEQHGHCDRVLVVDCSIETQIARVTHRSGLPREEVLRILAAQSTRETRMQVADDIVNNEGNFKHLAQQIERLDGLYRQLAHEKRQRNTVISAT
jgi:dephospho-CoA kinase